MKAEEENTFRALRDEDLIVTSFWCRFGFHRWTKWREPTETLIDGYKKYITQERRCAHCNKYDKQLVQRIY